MKRYPHSLIKLFFGNKSAALKPSVVRGKKSYQLLGEEPFSSIDQELILQNGFVFLHQVHGIKGMVITKENGDIPVFTQEGDYLLTNVPGIGIGVATADCMPIVLVDPVKKAIGVIHAGWKGLVAGVVEQAVEHMCGEYGSVFTDINFIIGPSAQVCCYEVGKDFFNQVCALRPSIESFIKKTVLKRQDRLFFDATLFFKLIFFEKGFVEGDFDFSYAQCTICKPVYCSYRREKMSPLRQLTIVSLK